MLRPAEPKQLCHGKGNGGVNEGYRGGEWEEFYEFTGTKLQEFPLPADLPLDLGRELDRLAQLLAAQEPTAVCERAVPTRAHLDAARADHDRLRPQMIALQEELDWEVYRAYGLLTDAEAKTLIADCVPEPLRLGERAFEIVLARKVAAGEAETAWFDAPRLHPDHRAARALARRVPRDRRRRASTSIEKRRDIALIERPECKRRWAAPAVGEEGGARRCGPGCSTGASSPSCGSACATAIAQPRTAHRQPARRPARRRRRTSSPSPSSTPPTTSASRDLAAGRGPGGGGRRRARAVPRRAALQGLRACVKRAEWERTWELQREEDRTGQNLHIPVPPKYKPADFRAVSYWSQRGKLDVPKERFVSYPGASRDADPTLLLGWAGWDHRDQAQALVNLVNDRTHAGRLGRRPRHAAARRARRGAAVGAPVARRVRRRVGRQPGRGVPGLPRRAAPPPRAHRRGLARVAAGHGHPWAPAEDHDMRPPAGRS